MLLYHRTFCRSCSCEALRLTVAIHLTSLFTDLHFGLICSTEVTQLSPPSVGGTIISSIFFIGTHIDIREPLSRWVVDFRARTSSRSFGTTKLSKCQAEIKSFHHIKSVLHKNSKPVWENVQVSWQSDMENYAISPNIYFLRRVQIRKIDWWRYTSVLLFILNSRTELTHTLQF